MENTARLLELLKSNRQTICSCESFTAGLFCSELASVPGASAVLKGGLVTYFSSMKEQLAHVPAELIETYGVISEQCALAMAEHTRSIMEADWCVSFTGNAGPGAMEGKPAGLVYCAVCGPDFSRVFFWRSAAERNVLRQEAVETMTDRLISILSKKAAVLPALK